MGNVFLDVAVSLDGFVSGPSGEDGGLHDWYFSPSGNAILVIDELLQGIGAMVLGKKAFGDQPNGFDTPYKVPHFVLSHESRDTVERIGATFIFVTDGIESALDRARAAAGDKDVCIAGGASTAQQYLRTGLLDEVQLHLVPVLFGGGFACLSWGPNGSSWSASRCSSRPAWPTSSFAWSSKEESAVQTTIQPYHKLKTTVRLGRSLSALAALFLFLNGVDKMMKPTAVIEIGPFNR